MPQRNTVVPSWLLDAAGAPRKGRVLDPVDEEDPVPTRKLPSLDDLPQIDHNEIGNGSGALEPSALAALASSLGNGAPSGGGAPSPIAMPTSLGPPSSPPLPPSPLPTGLAPTPGALPGPLPGGPPGGLPPALGAVPPGPVPGPPLAGLPGVGPVTGAPRLGAPSMPPLLPPTPPPSLAPPPSPQAPPTIGVGGGSGPAGQAPVMHINNSVVNVGQQRVSTQGASMGADTTAGGPPLPPGPSTVPDLTAPAPSADSLAATAAASPPDSPTPDASASPSVGPTWDHQNGRYV